MIFYQQSVENLPRGFYLLSNLNNERCGVIKPFTNIPMLTSPFMLYMLNVTIFIQYLFQLDIYGPVSAAWK